VSSGAPGLAVERAVAGDAPALRALAGTLLPGAGRPAAGAWLARRRSDGAALGYLDARRVVDELHVLALAVRPEARRRGVASALLGAALVEAEATGAAVCHLEVRAGNAAARAFYARHGFAEVGLRRRYYAEGEDAILLTRALRALRVRAAVLR